MDDYPWPDDDCVDDEHLAALVSPYLPNLLCATDRCDRCTARAAIVTSHLGYELQWCTHHYKAHQHLISHLVVHDQRGL